MDFNHQFLFSTLLTLCEKRLSTVPYFTVLGDYFHIWAYEDRIWKYTGSYFLAV